MSINDIYNQTHGMQVLGSILKQSDLIGNNNYPLVPNDFPIRLHKIIFTAAYNLYYSGVEVLNALELENYLSKYPELYEHYQNQKGVEFLLLATDVAEVQNYEYNYNMVKKYSLLRLLKQTKHYNIGYFYPEGAQDFAQQQQIITRLEKATLEDILQFYSNTLSAIQAEQQIKSSSQIADATDGIKELKELLKKEPEFGFNLDNSLLNTVVRGARKTKFYIESASSGLGKSRTMVANSCKLAYPFSYNWKLQKWEQTGNIIPTLYVTTEMSLDEVQTIILAYLTGINEDLILNGTYNAKEEKIIDQAIELMQQYPNNLTVYLLPDPSVKEVEHNIKRECIANKVEALFFDYIHTSPALITQFAAASIAEHVSLMLLSSALKNLANELNIFVWSATQTNYKELEDEGLSDQTCLRGSKSISDKVDVGIIKKFPKDEELKALKVLIENNGGIEPNRVSDIYKNRRGKYTRIRLWYYQDMGTGRTQCLFATNENGTPVDLPIIQAKVGEIKCPLNEQ